MSQSSSQSASSGHGGSGAGYGGQGSPVPYRIGPLEYQPAVLCCCKLKAYRWISWSIPQPGRRYYRCSKARRGGGGGDCGYFKWADEEFSDWVKELLGDLGDIVWKLKKDLIKKEEEVEEKDMLLVAKQKQMEEKQKEVEDKHNLLEVMQLDLNSKQLELNQVHQVLNDKQQELEAKEQALQALEEKLKNKNQCIDALVVLCLFLVIMMVFLLVKAM